MQIHGKINRISATQQVSDNFSKREFVLEIDHTTQYPQMILLEFTNAKCDLLNKYSEEQEVRVDFNLRGRNWTNKEGEIKTFNTLQAWRIELVGGAQPQQNKQTQQTTATPAATQTSAPANTDNNNAGDDFPF
ncbi:MAG: DUF3127 domain-containing protein [Nanoarchaeota archaeon]